MKVSEIKLAVDKEAKNLGLHFNQVLTMVSYERIIARLLKIEELRESVIFKGGMLMRLAYGSQRHTVDLDMSYEKIGQSRLEFEVENALNLNLEDGFSYNAVSWSKITEHKDYQGTRLTVDYLFLNKKINRIQMDFTLSELKKSFVEKNLKLTVDNEKLACRVYSPELIIAEKIHAMVEHGNASTRAKDLHDVNHLFRGKINKISLNKFIDQVFKTRKTERPKNFKSFFEALDKGRLESSWVKFKDLTPIEDNFEIVMKEYIKNLNAIDSNLGRGLSR